MALLPKEMSTRVAVLFAVGLILAIIAVPVIIYVAVAVAFELGVAAWTAAGDRLPAGLRPFAYFAGLAVSAGAGLAAPRVARFTNFFTARWLAGLGRFVVALTAGIIAVGAACVSLRCIAWHHGWVLAWNIVQLLAAFGAMLVGAVGGMLALGVNE